MRKRVYFSPGPACELLPDGRNVRLLGDFYAWVDGQTWGAKKGLETDGASIPRLLWPLIGGPFEGKYRRAAILHDAAYQLAREDWIWSALFSKERAAADRMLYLAARADGCAWWRAAAIWVGVRVGGAVAWQRDSSERKAHGRSGDDQEAGAGNG